ncbi:MAG: hypothetical protein ACFCU1_08470 [Sumerlaeia bacterium]
MRKFVSRCVLLAGMLAFTAVIPQFSYAQTAANPATPQTFNPLERGSQDQLQLIGDLITADEIVYGETRSTITYKDFSLTANRIVLDTLTLEFEAEGDVIITGKNEEIRASSARYNFRQSEGVAYDVEGVQGGLFFRSEWDEAEKGPSFRRISEDEALFQGATYTRSGFPVPTSYVKGREVILIPGERFFLRDASVWWRGVPVFYLPAYSRGFTQRSPWDIEVGFLSRYDFFTRIRYNIYSKTEVPSWKNPGEYITRSKGRIGVKADVFSAGAVGVGIDSEYSYDFERHIGELSLYGIRDSVRNVQNPSENEDERYLYRHRHNTMLGDTIYQLNADWMSDPDVYHDIEDRFDPLNQRGRLPERRFRTAATYLQEDWLARFSVEYKERITQDIYQDFAEPQNDNLLYDPDPDFARDTGTQTDGVTRNRYGRVSRKYQGRIATRLQPILGSDSPFYGRLEVNAFRNTDAGFNEFDQRDDQEIAGADVYYSATNRLRLDREGRFTWINTVGIGAGYYDRQNDEIIDSNRLGPGGAGRTVDGIPFSSNNTGFFSNGNRRISGSDLTPFHAWVDYTSRLSARFTDDLSGYLQYRTRKGTPDSLGEFYAKSGRQEAFEDVYDFPQDYNWVEAFLAYSPIQPNLDVYSRAGYNLEGQSDRFANEQEYYVGTGADYETNSGEWVYAAEVLYEGRQARDPQDPAEYNASQIAGNFEVNYIPVHGRHWASLRMDGVFPLDNDPRAQPARRERRFNEDDSDISIRPLIGRKFGPKYDVEVFAEYNSRIRTIDEAGILITRDLYDADLFVYVGTNATTNQNRDTNQGSSNDPKIQRELEFRLGLKLSTPNEQARLSGVSRKTLRDQQLEAQIVE